MIHLTSTVKRSPRVMQIEGRFDLTPSDHSEIDIAELPTERLDEQDWSVGLIVGPSGAGKSTVARHAFGDQLVEHLSWSDDRAIVDDFPTSSSETAQWLSSVGLSSPPTWVRPFSTLSNGEQFRATLARGLAQTPTGDTLVIDEFTSVVDRTVAQVGSAAVQRAVRKSGRRFVAVTCHYDVLDWLQPDWVYEPQLGEFRWRSVQPRPGIPTVLRPVDKSIWPVFARHHYLNTDLNVSARNVGAFVDGSPIAFVSTMALPSGSVQNAFRVHRIVTLPDWQGVGIGTRLLNMTGAAYRSQGRALYIATSHPGLVASLNRSTSWSMRRKPSRNSKNTDRRAAATSRLTTSFKYVGEASDDLRDWFHS